jgi:hypothetical protein
VFSLDGLVFLFGVDGVEPQSRNWGFYAGSILRFCTGFVNKNGSSRF